MANQLQYKPLDNVGMNGLNIQANPASLDPSWLTRADNIILRESGRISFRKGLKQNVLKTTAKIGSLIEHKDGSTNKTFAGVGTFVYTVDFTHLMSLGLIHLQQVQHLTGSLSTLITVVTASRLPIHLLNMLHLLGL